MRDIVDMSQKHIDATKCSNKHMHQKSTRNFTISVYLLHQVDLYTAELFKLNSEYKLIMMPCCHLRILNPSGIAAFRHI